MVQRENETIEPMPHLTTRTPLSDTLTMTGAELLRRLKALSARRSVPLVFDRKRGKGSHGTLYFGSGRAILPDEKRELKPGTARAILRELGLTPKDLE